MSGVEREPRRFHEMNDQIPGILVAEGDPNSGRVDTRLTQSVLVHLRMRGQRGTADDGVGLTQADHVTERGRQAVEETLEGIAIDILESNRHEW